MVNRTTNMTALKPCTDRSAFTLVEIMVTIIVLSILSSLVLFAMTGVLEMAKETQTKSRIAKLDREISRLSNGYLSRRVPIRTRPDLSRRQAAQVRLVALRDLMRLELPDRVTDVSVPPAVDFNGDYVIDNADRPAASKAYMDIALAHGWDGVNDDDFPVGVKPDEDGKNEKESQGAECLYMIVQFNVGAGTRGRSFFSESEVGDLDKDGMPEFLDAWGQPIRFLRWAPGLNSPLQDRNQHDPFDPHGVDDMWRSFSSSNQRFPLYPLVVSSGSNRQFGMAFDLGGVGMVYRQDIDMPNTHPHLKYYIDPYQFIDNEKQLGSAADPTEDIPDPDYSASDDIHNHLVETN